MMTRFVEPRPERLVDFSDPSGAADWTSVNDDVMGGRSAGHLRHDADGFIVLEGTLSLENGGGFPSVRGPVADGAATGAHRILARVRGDGRRYQLRVRMGRPDDKPVYVAEFDTEADVWTTVTVPIDDLEPRFRGEARPDAPRLDPGRIRQIGLMLADGTPGSFRLDAAWIDVE